MKSSLNQIVVNTSIWDLETVLGDIAPNQVIARSEFEVHRQIYTE